MVQVLSPTSILFAGSALTVTGFNDKGRFDILPSHANFVSLIRKTIIVRADKKSTREIEIGEGVLHCRNDQVRVFVGITGGGEEPVADS